MHSTASFIFEMWTWSDSGGESEDSIDQWAKREGPGSGCTAADVSSWVWEEIDDWHSAEQQRSSCNGVVGAVQSRGEKQLSAAAIKFSCPWFVGLTCFYVLGNSVKYFFHTSVIWKLLIPIPPETLQYFTYSFWSYFVTPCYYGVLPLRKLDCS